MSGAVLAGVKDSHARELLTRILSRLSELVQRMGQVESSTSVATFIPTSSGVVEYAALPATTGFEVATVIAVFNASGYRIYRLVKINAVGAVNWMALEGLDY